MTEASPQKVPGLTIGTKLILTFLLFTLILAGLLVFVYQRYVPPLVIKQIDLRTYSIAQSFASSVLEPTLVRNYLRVNKIAEATAKLPNVAYATVINNRQVPIAGLLGDEKRLDSQFVSAYKQSGFPVEAVRQNQVASGQDSSARIIGFGGQEVYDVALPLGQTGALVHIGLFTQEARDAVRETFIPLALLLGIMTVLGALAIIFVARTISRPIQRLTKQAEQISLGNLDQPVEIQGGGEIWQLGQAFQRMHASIKYLAEQIS